MARIRVGRGMFSVGFEQALQQCRPGDEIVLSEGVYSTETLNLKNIRITGAGTGEKVVINAQVNVAGVCHLSNIIIDPPPFHNSLQVTPSGAAIMHTVDLLADPAAKYPSVYVKKGTLEMLHCGVMQEDRTRAAVQTESGAVVRAEATELGFVDLRNSKAQLMDASAATIMLQGGSRLDCTGRLTLAPADGQRALVLFGESACSIFDLRLASLEHEALCQESFLRITGVHQPAETHLTVLKRGAGRVDAALPSVTIVDEDAASKALRNRRSFGGASRTRAASMKQ